MPSELVSSPARPRLWHLIVLVLMSVVGCSKPPVDIIKRGFVETHFTDKVGTEYTYLVFVPYDYEPGQNRPLLLFLNGKGENGSDGYWTVHNNFGVQVWEMKKHFPFVCAIPQCPEGETWSGATLDRALAFAEQVAAAYATDPDRYYITGVSAGGTGVWNAISQSPDLFAAAVPLAGIPRVDSARIAASGLPIWNHYNNGDKPELVEANRQAHASLLAGGVSPLVTEYGVEGHNCWERVYRSIPVYQWLLMQKRTPHRAESPRFQVLTAEHVVDSWTSVGEKRWKASGDQFSLSDSALESDHAEMLVSDQEHRTFQLHVDALLGESSTGCRIGITSSDAGLPQVLIDVPLSVVGIGGVYGEDGETLAELDPLAQRQLQPDFANDLRLELDHEALHFYVNGSLAVQVSIASLKLPESRAVRPILLADREVAWKNLRIAARE